MKNISYKSLRYVLVLATVELLAPVIPAPAGLWVNTTSMGTAREEHTATLLSNGTVLVAGGFNDLTSQYLETVEVYNPATGKWTPTTSLSIQRGGHTATLLPNGKVLVAGGTTLFFGDVSSAELYDPATGTWEATGSMTTPRSGHTATLLPNGKVLVVGGDDLGSGITSLTAELYDPAAGVNGSWTSAGSMTAIRGSGYTATLLANGNVLVAGGEYYSPTLGA